MLYTLNSPWRIVILLLLKNKAELKWLENLDVISKIDTPTEWYLAWLFYEA